MTAVMTYSGSLILLAFREPTPCGTPPHISEISIIIKIPEIFCIQLTHKGVFKNNLRWHRFGAEDLKVHYFLRQNCIHEFTLEEN